MNRSKLLSIFGGLVAITGAAAPFLHLIPAEYAYLSTVIACIGAVVAGANRSLIALPSTASRNLTVVGVAMAVLGALTPYLDYLPDRYRWVSIVTASVGAALATVNQALSPKRRDEVTPSEEERREL